MVSKPSDSNLRFSTENDDLYINNVKNIKIFSIKLEEDMKIHTNNIKKISKIMNMVNLVRSYTIDAKKELVVLQKEVEYISSIYIFFVDTTSFNRSTSDDYYRKLKSVLDLVGNNKKEFPSVYLSEKNKIALNDILNFSEKDLKKNRQSINSLLNNSNFKSYTKEILVFELEEVEYYIKDINERRKELKIKLDILFGLIEEMGV